jgi:hypothetical protein
VADQLLRKKAAHIVAVVLDMADQGCRSLRGHMCHADPVHAAGAHCALFISETPLRSLR